MKLFLCLVVLVFAAVNAETPEAEASQAKAVILVQSAPQLLKPKPLAPYKPLPLKVVKPKAILISSPPQPLRPKPTLAPYKKIAIKVVPIPTPARKPVNIQKGAAGASWWG
ncbi:uncharacterized protein LOC129948179 [Eupeodes corollae]|uniref:uncharacterized protein LOC129948179 n=1 Tax=Eupeodes corollae TaxID=290404 RepID=UPI00249073DC|nr:uncharacterized protein LOC129948179 [Eupeodes corollae]